MSNWKRVLAMLLTVAALLSMLPMAALAAEAEAAPEEAVAAETPDEPESETPAASEAPDEPESEMPAPPEEAASADTGSEEEAPTAVEPASGACGEHLTWMLDESGTLTISGTGDMYNFLRTSRSPGKTGRMRLLRS